MIDVCNLPLPPEKTQVFRPFSNVGSGSNAKGFQVWKKPRGCSIIHILTIGSGAAGGNGFSSAAGSQRGGGGGGGSGGLARAIYMADTLPDILYIQVGAGGTVQGQRTVVAVAPQITAPYIVLASSNADQGGGNSGSSSGGTGGSGATITTNATGAYINHAIGFTAIAGQNGGNGGTGDAAGTSVTCLTNIPISGGAGGGGCLNVSQNGGAITGAGLIATIPGASGGGKGSGGVLMDKPLTATGASGGGSSSAGAGGAGGEGQIGSGGGGGGAGTTPSSGGAGGKGGDGLCIIVAI